MTARSKVYFDRRRWIFIDFRLIALLACVVSKVVHSFVEDSKTPFHALDTAKQILIQSSTPHSVIGVGETYTRSRMGRC